MLYFIFEERYPITVENMGIPASVTRERLHDV
jgi:hypothetical protein